MSAVRATINHLKDELTGHYDDACAVEGGDKPKKPRLSDTSSKLAEQLQRAGGTSPLTYKSE